MGQRVFTAVNYTQHTTVTLAVGITKDYSQLNKECSIQPFVSKRTAPNQSRDL